MESRGKEGKEGIERGTMEAKNISLRVDDILYYY